MIVSKDMRVAIVGMGGLGCPASLALVHAGVSSFTLFDPDKVELSNLHRQILYSEADLGAFKVDVARRKLLSLRPNLDIRIARTKARRDDLLNHDVVVDGTDRFETKLWLNDACVDQGIAYVFAGTMGLEGLVMLVVPKRSSCLRCLFDEAPPPGAQPTCADVGIVGPIAGIVGARQGQVALSLQGDAPMVDGIWCYDGRRDRSRWVPVQRQADCKGCGSRKDERGAYEPLEAQVPVHAIDAPELDLRASMCPETFHKSRRAVDALGTNDRLWIRLGSDEAARSVPVSLRTAGHRILARIEHDEDCRVLVARGKTTQEGDAG